MLGHLHVVNFHLRKWTYARMIPLEDSDDSVDSMPIQTPGSKECVSGRGKKRLTQEVDLQVKNEKKPKGPIV